VSYPFHRQKEGSFCLADYPYMRRAVYSTSQCALDEFLGNFSIWYFTLELTKVIAKIEDFIPVLSRSSWFVLGAQEVMYRAKQNEPSAGGRDTDTAPENRRQSSPRPIHASEDKNKSLKLKSYETIAEAIDNNSANCTQQRFPKLGKSWSTGGYLSNPRYAETVKMIHWPIHYSRLRNSTIREAACIQGFPHEHKFVGNMTEKKKQIGNAVPHPIGKAIMGEVMKTLRRTDGLESND